MDSERRNSLLLFAGLGIVVVFAIVLIGYGYYNSKIAPKHDTVLKVGQKTYDMAAVERRITYDIANGALSSGTNDPNQIVGQSLQTMEQQELLRQTARAQGVYPTDDDIKNQIKTTLNVQSGVDENTFAIAYRSGVLRSGLTPNEYRDIMAADIIQARYTDQFKAAVPDQGEQVRPRVLEVAAQKDAEDAVAKARGGENLGLIAGQISIHYSKPNGGDVGFVPRGTLPAAVDDVAFSQQVGEISDPIQVGSNWWVVETRDRKTDAINDNQKQAVANQKMSDMLQDTRTKLGSTIFISSARLQQIVQDVFGGLNINSQPAGAQPAQPVQPAPAAPAPANPAPGDSQPAAPNGG